METGRKHSLAQGGKISTTLIKIHLYGNRKKGLLECKIPNLKSNLFYCHGNAQCHTKDNMSCPDIGNIYVEGERRKKLTYIDFESLHE